MHSVFERGESQGAEPTAPRWGGGQTTKNQTPRHCTDTATAVQGTGTRSTRNGTSKLTIKATHAPELAQT